MGMGPAGDGVLHTSGNAIAMPLEAAWTTVLLLTFTVAGMSSSVCVGQLGSATTVVAPRQPLVDEVVTRAAEPAPGARARPCAARPSSSGPAAAPTSPM